LDDRYRFLCKYYGYDDTVTWINKKANATVFQTEYCKSLYTQGVSSIFGYEEPLDVKNGVIIYNGVDREVFSERGPGMELEGEYKIFHVSTTGMPRKGLGTVLEYAHMLRNNPDFQFYLVGRQDEDPVFGYEIKKFENVHHFGHTNDRYELASYYRSGDILLYPTINDCSPNVVLEAMSCGMPVVAANSGGSPELIYKDNVHGGILIDDRNPIFALKEVVNHLDLFKERAIELVKKYHRKEIMGQNYLELFKSLM
jgi:glycosyltransferase involved in cell wall biosynthesis